MDLYNDDMVGKLVRKTAEKLEIRTDYVREVLAELTTMLEEKRLQLLESQGNSKPEKRIPTETGRKAAIVGEADEDGLLISGVRRVRNGVKQNGKLLRMLMLASLGISM